MPIFSSLIATDEVRLATSNSIVCQDDRQYLTCTRRLIDSPATLLPQSARGFQEALI